MLGKIYTKEGNLEQAIEYYDKSRNLRQPNILADKQIDALRAQLNMPEEPEDAAAVPEPVEGVEGQEENIVAPEPVEGQETEPAEGEEGFDFGTMGDNVPMQEALQEQEGEFFDDDEEPEEQVHEAARNHVEALFGKSREHMEQGEQRRSENQAADSEDCKRGELRKQPSDVLDAAKH